MFGSTLRRISPLLLSAALLTALTGLPAGATQDDPPRPVAGANSDLRNACGIDVVLVLDTSGSIAISEAQGEVRDSAKAFLNALVGTGSAVSLVTFATGADLLSPPVVVTDDSIDDLEALITGLSNDEFTGATNWEDALLVAHSQFAVAPFNGAPELVVMITDGNPTVYNGNTGSGGTTNDIDVDKAVVQANDIKDGSPSTHMFALGVGGDVDTDNLMAISGNDPWTGDNLSEADWAEVSDFENLPAALTAIATSLCEQTVVIHKVVANESGAGFEFTAAGQEPVVTDSEGVATFSWTAPLGVETTISELPKDGYRLESVECTSDESDESVGEANDADGIDLSVGPKERVDCTFTNVKLPVVVAEVPTTTTTTTTVAPSTTTTIAPIVAPATVLPTQVLGEVLVQPSAELPRTGSNPMTLLLTAGVLLLAGLTLVAGNRKTRKA